jgi:dTMP kinase
MSPEKGLLKPDSVIYLTLSTEAMAKRGNFGDEIYETSEMQKKVKKVYESMIELPVWKVVDADKTEDQLSDELEDIIKKSISEAAEEPINYL